MQLIIRADGDSRIGAGHVMRNIALAEYWRAHVGGVAFVTNCPAPAIQSRISSSSLLVPAQYQHPDPRDLALFSSLLMKHKPAETWVAIDGYHFDTAYQRAIRATHRLVVLDDFAHLGYYDADVVVNQNLEASSLPYFVAPETKLLLGTDYVLMRREFMDYRRARPEAPAIARHLLVTFGGADPNNVTLRALEAILMCDEHFETRILIGPANQNGETLIAAARQQPVSVEFVTASTDIPSLMGWADLALSGAGSTCWEFAFMGVPIITVSLAENQSRIAQGLARHGCAVALGVEKQVDVNTMASALASVARDRSGRAAMSLAGQSLVDGRGPERVAASLLAA